jgi:hypothetical protein
LTSAPEPLSGITGKSSCPSSLFTLSFYQSKSRSETHIDLANQVNGSLSNIFFADRFANICA